MLPAGLSFPLPSGGSAWQSLGGSAQKEGIRRCLTTKPLNTRKLNGPFRVHKKKVELDWTGLKLQQSGTVIFSGPGSGFTGPNVDVANLAGPGAHQRAHGLLKTKLTCRTSRHRPVTSRQQHFSIVLYTVQFFVWWEEKRGTIVSGRDVALI
ncbi:uncharacterized protein BO96DRAFT_133377 [Aspergillus niger CBS 101883]|uniref:uncharacterized protein n=1 Tax=Aspergillus lacticoffeatus (strain CBS 101883) TaxID=1450533 RepID=UPI000D7F1B6E|nr:uncharacterized protein BO96DRAFT_133377 [Aspergillus niger CBS 101883]PYH53076.1 hypothetical protein BO96DRAFT_133377 [Aspergillus niger CBS 101883]